MLGFTIGVNVLEGNKRRKRKITERRINVKCRRGSCKCVTHTGHGDLHNFPSMHIASPFQTCPRFVLCSLDQAFKTWEPSCLCQFSGACLLAKTVACDGAREVRSCLWPDAASVEVAAGSHTTTLPRCQGRPRWGRPPRSVLGSRQLLLTLGLQQGAPGRRPRRWNLELLLSAKVALFPLIIAEWTKWQGLMWALETLGRSTSRHHQHNNPLLSSFHV